MTHVLKRRAGILLLALLAIFASVLVSTPSSAAPAASSSRLLSCDYSWPNIPWQQVSWGKAKLCEVDGLSGDGVTNGGTFIKTQTADILTDGWCVKVQYRYGGVWYDVPGSQACSAATTTSSAADPPLDWSMTAIRLVRGQCTPPYTPGICVNYTTLFDLN